jgi:carotenoid cleavage dioxygenase-like enzyme
MTQQVKNRIELSPDRCSARVPQSLMNSSRTEFGSRGVPPVQLHPNLEQRLPEDLQGHVFIIGPVGFEDTPYGKGTPIFNGDGMVYRIDFNQPGEAHLKTEIARTPCFYADLATRTRQKYAKYRFRNWGHMRFSIPLGLRNPVNTAFLPMKFPHEQSDRLLITYDAGRPYEIDPKTLEVKTPVGTNQEWRGITPSFLNQPFPVVLSTAHPAFDAYTGEMFTVNYGRAVANLLSTVPFIDSVNNLPQAIKEFLAPLANAIINHESVQQILGTGLKFTQDVFKISAELSQGLFKTLTGVEDFTYLIRWDGEGGFERWKLVLPNGSPVKIEQSLHQIGVTQDFVVLIDTAFKVGADQILNNPLPDIERTETALRVLLTRPQLSDSNVYIVRRDQLRLGQRPACSNAEETVTVIPLVLPLESIHFAVDYDNPDRKITLYIAHNCATDVSEFVRGYDISAYHPPDSLPSHLDGMLAIGQMDVNRMGRYVIDGDRGAVLDSKVVHNNNYTFGVGLFTYREILSSGKAAKKIEDIYAHSWGFWEELMPQFIFDLYKNYKYRLMSLEEIRKLPHEDKPVYLFRLHTETMEFADHYQFPKGYMMSSPQFVPRKNGTDSPTDGYIVCSVNTPKGDEIWIFDAEKLFKGPVCQLSYPGFNFGYTIHTTWLPEIDSRIADYHISVRPDYEELVKQQPQDVQDMFEQDIYPHFEQ